MIFNKLRSGQITIEVSAIMPEKILNILWHNEIYTSKVIKVDLTTVRFKIPFKDYKEAEALIKKGKGKMRVVGKSGIIVLLLRMKRKSSLVVGAVLFFGVLYYLSNYIWAIDIKTKENLSPFEVRQQLEAIGIKPGLKKSQINVYNIEKKMEDLNNQIMWIRTRVEGSTLKLVIEEKVNPPSTEKIPPNQVLAKMDGEVKRVFTTSGNSAVIPGDIVKTGDVLILPIQGREGFERDVKPSGTVIANTFYEKSMEVQISGKKLERTGKRDKDIYLSLWGKKIYLKKAINGFESYDKIEESNGFFNEVIYFERAGKEVKVDKDAAATESLQKLQASLEKTLSNDAKIINNKMTVEDIDSDKINVKVIFTVEQNIASNIS